MDDGEQKLETTPAGPEPRRMSLAARLLNVFAVPGDVFADVKRAPGAASNWLVPALLGAVVGVIFVNLFLAQPAIQKQIHERRSKLIEEASNSGKLTAQQRHTAEQLTSPGMLKFFGVSGAIAGSFLSVLWWGLVLWFLARRMLRVEVGFGKALEVAGLATMIDVLGAIVAMVLVVNLGRMGATPSLALAVKDFDMSRKGHLFAAAANVFSFWVVGVRSIGLAKLANVPYLRAAWLVVTFWILQQSVAILTGLAQLSM